MYAALGAAACRCFCLIVCTLPVGNGDGLACRDAADVSGISALLGEYRTACLFSKTWALREAGLHKTRLMLRDELSSDPGIAACLGPVAMVVKGGINDKIAQVFSAAGSVLDEVIAALHRWEQEVGQTLSDERYISCDRFASVAAALSAGITYLDLS